MNANYFIYAIAILISTFAVSGINFDNIIKKNHVWEARFLVVILILLFSYIISHVIMDFI